MKKQIAKLFGIATLSFTLSFAVGMSVSTARMERMELEQLQAQELVLEDAAALTTTLK